MIAKNWPPPSSRSPASWLHFRALLKGQFLAHPGERSPLRGLARKNLLLLVVCSVAAYFLQPRHFSIAGVHLNESRAELLKRFPDARNAPNGMEMGGGESRVCRGFCHFHRCLELQPHLIVALDSSDRVEAVEGPQLELNGARILGQDDGWESVKSYLGKPIYAGSSDATYCSYAEATTRFSRDLTLYALKRR